MNVDYQVVTVKNQIKSKDIGGLDVKLMIEKAPEIMIKNVLNSI